MGKARNIADAEQQVVDEAWKCKTCEAPADDAGDGYCPHCRSYWNDASEFDNEPA